MPAEAGDEVRAWLGEARYLPQADGQLGERMESAFTQAFADGYEQVVVVGSDLPAVTTALLKDAFAALRDREAVFGPAVDGGYYLVGLRGPVAGLSTKSPGALRRCCR